ADFFPGHRIMISGSRRFGDERGVETMTPPVQSKHMVVPESGAEVGVYIPSLADPLHRHDLALLMAILQRPLERDRVAFDFADAGRLESTHFVHTHAQLSL